MEIAQKIKTFMDPIVSPCNLSHIRIALRHFQLQRRTIRDISDPNDKWRIAKKDGHSVDDVTLVSLHLYKNVWVPELVVAW
jgi:hypothetical protein